MRKSVSANNTTWAKYVCVSNTNLTNSSNKLKVKPSESTVAESQHNHDFLKTTLHFKKNFLLLFQCLLHTSKVNRHYSHHTESNAAGMGNMTCLFQTLQREKKLHTQELMIPLHQRESFDILQVLWHAHCTLQSTVSHSQYRLIVCQLDF